MDPLGQPMPTTVVGVPAFDPVLAAAVASALGRFADSLDQAATALGGSAAGAAVDWKGFTRRWFDIHHEEAVVALRRTARQARDDAAAVVVAPAVLPTMVPPAVPPPAVGP